MNPHSYIALVPRAYELINISVHKERKSTIIMLKISDTTLQKFSWLGNQVPWICAPLSAILELSDDIIKTHFKTLFLKKCINYQIKCARADANIQHCNSSKRHMRIYDLSNRTV